MGIRRNSPKVTYLIFQRGSTGESFFFYGLIDFRLFLIKMASLCLADIFFCLLHPEYLTFGSVSYEPCQTTNFFLFYFCWREGVPTSISGSQPIVWLLPSSPLGQAILLGLLDVNQVRLLSTDRLPQFTIMP